DRVKRIDLLRWYVQQAAEPDSPATALLVQARIILSGAGPFPLWLKRNPLAMKIRECDRLVNDLGDGFRVYGFEPVFEAAQNCVKEPGHLFLLAPRLELQGLELQEEQRLWNLVLPRAAEQIPAAVQILEYLSARLGQPPTDAFFAGMSSAAVTHGERM